MNKKISFVITDMSNGGAERVISLLANYFSDKNMQVDILAIKSDNKVYSLNSNINFKYIGCKKNKIANFFWRISKLRKETKDSDVVISFLWHCNVYMLIATMFTNKLRIISERSNPNEEMLGKFKYFKWFRNLCYLMADKIVFQTTWAMSCYKGSLNKKGVVIPNPITPNLPEVINKREDKIVAVGRLSSQKNYILMLESYKKFIEKYPEYSLEIYGEGDERKLIQTWIDDNKLTDKIKLVGFSKNVISEISNAKLFLNSSNFEGISNSMLEALAMGIPVVATDCPAGGAKQFVKCGYNGELVPMNDKDKFVDAMEKIISDDVKYKKLTENAFLIRKKLSIQKIGEEWLKLI